MDDMEDQLWGRIQAKTSLKQNKRETLIGNLIIINLTVSRRKIGRPEKYFTISRKAMIDKHLSGFYIIPEQSAVSQPGLQSHCPFLHSPTSLPLV